MKILFLASGAGGNMKFLYLAQKLGIIKNIELFVVADRECDSYVFAKNNHIYAKLIEYKQTNNRSLLSILNQIKPDIIVTNWHKIIDEEVVNKYLGKLINLHYSLLPAFEGFVGIKPIEKAYEKGCGFVGGTCHYIDNGVDTGKIISQTIVKSDVTIEQAIATTFKQSCLILLNSIVIIFDQESLIDQYHNEKLNFSPSLKFNDELFNTFFWERLKKL